MPSEVGAPIHVGGLDAAFSSCVRRADLAACAGPGDGRDPCPGPTHRCVCPARHGSRAGGAVFQLSPRAQPQHIVQPLAVPPPVPLACRHLRPERRPGGDRPRRHHRTAMGPADQSTWHLSRPGPFSHGHFVKASGLRWLSLMLLPVLGPGGVGHSRPDCHGPLEAVLAPTPVRQAPAQETHRLRQTGPDPGGALATAPADHRHWRRQLRRHRPAQ
jgi:hypothetical protein